MDDERLWELYFKQDGVSSDTVAKIRCTLEENLDADLSRLRDADDFSKEMAFFWDFDSMADVEIMEALEKEFSIIITYAEAAAMKTLRDIVLGVHRKLQPLQPNE